MLPDGRAPGRCTVRRSRLTASHHLANWAAIGLLLRVRLHGLA
jgi:hypothetical protein